MAETENMKLYKEEVTERGAMKIEVVLEEAKKKKRPASARSRPGSATSVRCMEDIERRQQAAEERRKKGEASQLAQLAEKKKKGEDVRSKKVANGDKLEEGVES
eukprot:TRINITY_DN11520_c0_g1_i5.p1 TRINITY_DN11520_c0_g1~~TRINITY_DN11520_c0_g1_i5.p1  ORF type:complete len:115 (-),score=53.75 TRINITY_DN11520_c0_g1_i5:53-364(-)